MRHEDVFDSELQTLEKSTEVTYEVVEGMEGPEAKNVYKT